MSNLSGVKVGPLDPDRTADFGNVSQSNNARTLIRLHSQMYPQVLVRALALKQDVQRTQGLDMDEVRNYLADVELENGDPAVPEGAEVVGAAVRGERDNEQVLTYTYRNANGRTAKWFAPYNADVLPESYDEGSERVHLHELREKGLVATSQAGSTARERGTTRNASEAGDVRLAKENNELRKRLEATERELAAARVSDGNADGSDAADGGDGEPEEPTAAQEPPIEGYDDLKAADLVRRIKSDDTPLDEVQAVLDFERTHDNRRSVVGAAEARLGANGRP